MAKSGNKFIRVWEEFPVDEIKKHIIIIDDLYGSCGNCKQLGLNYIKDKTCKGCGTDFKFITTKLKSMTDTMQILSRIQQKDLNLKLIEKEDYDKAIAHNIVDNLFKT